MVIINYSQVSAKTKSAINFRKGQPCIRIHLQGGLICIAGNSDSERTCNGRSRALFCDRKYLACFFPLTSNFYELWVKCFMRPVYIFMFYDHGLSTFLITFCYFRNFTLSQFLYLAINSAWRWVGLILKVRDEKCLSSTSDNFFEYQKQRRNNNFIMNHKAAIWKKIRLGHSDCSL